MRTRHLTLILVILLMLNVGTELAPSAQESADTSWLLTSPLRQELSGAGESLLLRKHGYAPTEAPTERMAPSPSFPRIPLPAAAVGVPISNLRVNDPAADTPDRTTQNETTIAVFGPNVVAGWNDSGAVLSTGDFTGYGQSTDGGSSFTDQGGFPPPTGGTHSGDPVVVADGSGNFYFATLSTDSAGTSIIGVGKSTDNGATFGT